MVIVWRLKLKNKQAIGVVLFGLYFFADAFFQLYVKLLKPGYYAWYSMVFEPSPERIIFLRYLFSIIFRILELTAGVGLILRREISRKLILLVSWFAIAIVYWKHPFNAVFHHAQVVVHNIGPLAQSSSLSLDAQAKLIAWISLGCLYLIDIGVSVATIYYFTRPYVKERFVLRGPLFKLK